MNALLGLFVILMLIVQIRLDRLSVPVEQVMLVMVLTVRVCRIIQNIINRQSLKILNKHKVNAHMHVQVYLVILCTDM